MINHPVPIKQESTQETLPAVFLMEKQCAPLSPSSNKHRPEFSLSSLSLSLSSLSFLCPGLRLHLSLCVSVSLAQEAAQVTASHPLLNYGNISRLNPQRPPSLSFMGGPRDHVAVSRWTASGVNCVYRAKPGSI